jgi:hypothetical protein
VAIGKSETHKNGSPATTTIYNGGGGVSVSHDMEGEREAGVSISDSPHTYQ